MQIRREYISNYVATFAKDGATKLANDLNFTRQTIYNLFKVLNIKFRKVMKNQF